MARRSVLMLSAALLAGACVAPEATPPAASVPAPDPYSQTELETVLGSTARALTDQFGAADLDLREGPARKLQFVGPICVLDAYLYPPRGGRGDPVVTHVDARLPDGRTMDRSSCVAALTRRREAR